jgi:serine/threonine protein kinase
MNNENQQLNPNGTIPLYTNDFISFIAMCLQKNPNDRPTANELLNVNINYKKKEKRIVFFSKFF